MSHYPWNVLGIEETRDQSVIRKAYSAKLKTMNLDDQIQDYAELRGARDFALSIARQPPPGNPTELGEGAEHPVTMNIAFLESERDTAFADDFDFAADDAFDDLYVGGHGGLGDGLGGGYGPSCHRGPALSERWEDPGQAREPDKELIDAWRTLERIVFPDGQPSDDAMDAEEYAAADAAQKIILDRAGTGDINQFNAIDRHLSEIMAAGWPRSAPLVEAANEEFHWIGEAGQLIERPALQFLNARIISMRFNDEVLREDHPFHKAWKDLAGGDSTPVFLKRWWLKRDRVLELLGVIRGNYPELEYLLDGERILKWENASTSSFARIIQWIAIIYFGLTALSFCAGRGDKSTEDVLATDVMGTIEPQVTEALLGVALTKEQLVAKDPEFANVLTNTALLGYFDKEPPGVEGSIERGRRVLRRQMLAARDKAEFDVLLRIHELYLGWLVAAEAAGPEKCRQVLQWEDLTAGQSGAESLAREQALARDLLDQGLLSEESGRGTRSANVPGWLIGEVIDNGRFSEARVREALGNQDSPDRCGVMIDLMKAVARKPGRVDAALLRFP